MKFLLVETPSKDNVWLHLDSSRRIGVSLWYAGSLAHVEHPALWLLPYVWIAKIVPIKIAKKMKLTGPNLCEVIGYAFHDAAQAVNERNRALLAQSMCTIYGYQQANGAPDVSCNIQGTLGRVLALDHFSKKPYVIGITKQKVWNLVLK